MIGEGIDRSTRARIEEILQDAGAQLHPDEMAFAALLIIASLPPRLRAQLRRQLLDEQGMLDG